jgi:hypothetical protein
MKVLDLKCQLGHSFEGWFGSEQDFLSQCVASQVCCPICNDSHIVKQLSAPRLLLSSRRAQIDSHGNNNDHVYIDSTKPFDPAEALAEIVTLFVSNSTDVGDKFAVEARKIFYGESTERAIRGTATRQEARALSDEGIDIIMIPTPIRNKVSIH